jgi:hypothetical protein
MIYAWAPRARVEAPGSIRGRFAASDTRNSTHGSGTRPSQSVNVAMPLLLYAALITAAIHTTHRTRMHRLGRERAPRDRLLLPRLPASSTPTIINGTTHNTHDTHDTTHDTRRTREKAYLFAAVDHHVVFGLVDSHFMQQACVWRWTRRGA